VAAQAIQEVNITVRALRSASEEVEGTRRAKIAAEETVKGENVRFELGQTANEDLLRAQDVLAAAEREHLQALLTFNQTLVELGRVQGTLLEDLGIEVVHPKENRSQRPEPLRVRLHEGPRAQPPPAEEH
jgi:outer membrane protein TolC